MNRFLIPLASLMTVLTVGFSLAWIQAKGEREELLATNQTLLNSNDSLAAANQGLQDANKLLHERIKEMRDAPPLYTEKSQDAVAESLPPAEEVTLRLAEEKAEVAAAPEEDKQEVQARPTLTPEQQEQRERMLAEREARREEWRKRREEYRNNIRGEIQNRQEFFAQVPMEGLAPEYRESSERLQVALAEMDGLMENLSNPELNRNDRRQIMRNMYSRSREVNQLMGVQREILYNDLAQESLGLNADETKAFIETMETINKMTNPSVPGMNGSGR